MLEISSGIEEIGRIPLHLFLSLLAAYVLVYVCIFKGIESSRIVSVHLDGFAFDSSRLIYNNCYVN